jgi:rhodanese-related sulfurtransferase
MAATVAEITCDALWQRIESGAELVIVDALSPISYAGAHLPGAVNIPAHQVDELAPRRLPDPGADIVVYCQNVSCESSVEVAERLVALGYRNVLHFAGGKDEWRRAGLPLEGGRI